MPKSRVIHNPYASKKRPRSEVANTPLEKAPPSAPASSSASLPQPAPASSSSNDSSTASRTSKTAGALIISAAGKAGIPTNLRADIDRIILRESQGSLYLQQQEKRDAKVNAKIQNLKTQLIQQEESASGDWKRKLEQEIEPFLSESIQNRPNRSTCVVVDCDAFYWSCAALSLPKSYEQLPCVVGGSMILTSNYAARKYGVRSAMAGWIADKLVEELSQGREKLIHVKSDYALYKEKSKQVVSVLREYDANLKAYSLDEAYMNLGPYLACALQNHHHHHHPDVSTHEQIQQALGQESSYSKDYVTILGRYSSEQCCQALERIVDQMRAQVTEATQGLTVSAGIAPNHMLAKIASDYNKPNGQTMVPPEHDSVKPFLYPLPTRKVSGIGRVTEKMLQQFGISTVQELYDKRALVKFLFQPATANFLLRVSVGCSSSSSISGGEDDADEEERGSNGQKGISRERTFAPESSWKELCKKLDHVAEMLSEDMQGKDLWARTITGENMEYMMVSFTGVESESMYFDLLKLCSALDSVRTFQSRSNFTLTIPCQSVDHFQLACLSKLKMICFRSPRTCFRRFEMIMIGIPSSRCGCWAFDVRTFVHLLTGTQKEQVSKPR